MQIGLARLAFFCLLLASPRLAWSQENDKGQPSPPATPAAKIGQDAPDFTLLDFSGKKHKLSDHKDKIVVLEWVNQQCPYSVGAIPIMKELRKKYAGKDIVWRGVESTFWRKPEENAQYARDKDLDFPILMDNDGTVGRLYGAKVTPHIYVINKGTLAYAGALRSKTESGPAEAGGRNYLDETLQALLAGKPVPVAETTPWGCKVQYKAPPADKKETKPATETKDK